MAWAYTLTEVQKPGLLSITAEFTLQKDGVAYCTDRVVILPVELEGKTNAQKLQVVKTRIEQKVSEYILVFNAASGLEDYVGQTVNL